ncbi:hypothetical protein C8J56DRAFT_1133269 [Mycena floridula]|nr:hypothetical protein C8J56DRAFT_1133269 [Mycena floridula]
MGVFAWEWLISLDFDLSFLLGQRKLKWPLFFYFYGRYASLGCLIGMLIIMDIGHPVHCQAAYISTSILGDTAICAATINLSIRTMVVWAYDTRIMATLIVLILGHFTVITLNISHGQLDRIASGNRCVLTRMDPKVNAAMFMYTSGIDLIVMCLMAFKVFRYRQDKISTLLLRDGLIYFLVVFFVNVVAVIFSLLNFAAMFMYTSGIDLIVMCLMAFKVFRYRQDKISTLLLRDGLIYFLVVFFVNVVAVIFSLLNLNPLMSVIADTPARMFTTIAAGRVALTDAVGADYESHLWDRLLGWTKIVETIIKEPKGDIHMITQPLHRAGASHRLR